MKTVFLDYDTVSNGDLDTAALRRAAGELTLLPADDTKLFERLHDAQIVLTNKSPLTRERLIQAPKLRLIALSGTGTDNVDLAAARELHLAVCNVRSYCTASVVQQVWGLILSLTQRLHETSILARDGTWSAGARDAALRHPIRELAGRTFGVVGWGELGRACAQAAQAFGMHILIANRAGQPERSDRVPLQQLLAKSDIVSLHCPLNDVTRGMIGAAQLARMKPDALLINTARGALIDTQALAAALKAGRLGGAGIDVLPHEPPTNGEALLDPTIPNLLVTPHVAWAAREARQRCIDEMAANVQDFLAGGRRNRVV